MPPVGLSDSGIDSDKAALLDLRAQATGAPRESTATKLIRPATPRGSRRGMSKQFCPHHMTEEFCPHRPPLSSIEGGGGGSSLGSYMWCGPNYGGPRLSMVCLATPSRREAGDVCEGRGGGG